MILIRTFLCAQMYSCNLRSSIMGKDGCEEECELQGRLGCKPTKVAPKISPQTRATSGLCTVLFRPRILVTANLGKIHFVGCCTLVVHKRIAIWGMACVRRKEYIFDVLIGHFSEGCATLGVLLN